MNLVPYSLMIAGLVFLLPAVLGFSGRKGFPAPRPDTRILGGRRRARFILFWVGFLLIWSGVFLLIRGYR